MGHPLADWLEKHGLSQQQFADAVGSPVYQTRLSAFLTGKIARLSPGAALAIERFTANAVNRNDVLFRPMPGYVKTPRKPSQRGSARSQTGGNRRSRVAGDTARRRGGAR